MGTEEFWVPAVLAAVSAGAQAVNQNQANQRQQAAETQNIVQQQGLRNQATAGVKSLVNQVSQNSTKPIQDQITGGFINALRQNAAGSTQGGSTSNDSPLFGAPVSALAPAAGASKRYKGDLATSQKQVQDFGNTEAGEMGAIDAAVRQRQNEGLAAQTLGTNLNTIGAGSYADNFVNQLRAQAAGQTNPWVSLGSAILGQYASGLSKNAGGGNGGNPSWLVPTNPNKYAVTSGP